MMSESSTAPVRSYERTWDEIEQMLERAEIKRKKWKDWFRECRKNGDREGMKEAARNHKGLGRCHQDPQVDPWRRGNFRSSRVNPRSERSKLNGSEFLFLIRKFPSLALPIRLA